MRVRKNVLLLQLPPDYVAVAVAASVVVLLMVAGDRIRVKCVSGRVCMPACCASVLCALLAQTDEAYNFTCVVYVFSFAARCCSCCLLLLLHMLKSTTHTASGVHKLWASMFWTNIYGCHGYKSIMV